MGKKIMVGKKRLAHPTFKPRNPIFEKNRISG